MKKENIMDKKVSNVNGNKISYNLIIGKGLDPITLTATESDVLKMLGKPNEQEHDKGVECSTTDFNYTKYGISLSFIYFDNFDNNLQIHTKKVVYNGTDWQNTNKQAIIKTIKTIYAQNGFMYKPKYELNDYEEFKYEQYEFEPLGLTLYFEDNHFDGAVITKPEIY